MCSELSKWIDLYIDYVDFYLIFICFFIEFCSVLLLIKFSPDELFVLLAVDALWILVGFSADCAVGGLLMLPVD